MSQLPATEFSKDAIKRVRYSHDAMIDLVLAEPSITQNEIAARFERTQAWISRIFCSDAFQARLAQRKSELVDPTIVASIEERLRGLAYQATEVISNKLTAQPNNADLAMKALEVSSRALGFGARSATVQINNSFAVALPPKIVDAAEWAAKHGRAPIQAVAEPSQGD